MMNFFTRLNKHGYFWPIISLALLTGSIILGVIAYQQTNTIETLLHDRNIFLLEISSTSKRLTLSETQASSTISDLTVTIEKLMSDNKALADELHAEKNRNEDFEKKINKIAGTVGVLDKLSKTDEELLQKYSKVYFLSEHYVPSRLKLIPDSWLAPNKKEQYFHADALSSLTEMLEDAKDDGVSIKIASAYRSFETQADLKGAYLQSYGTGANTFSADQGYSEHQLGTAIDFSTPDLGGSLDGFGGTKAYAWLKENAHKYGFILSYPQGNAYYVYEPWHWRFVGESLAKDLHNADANFYDWDQRKINDYLVKIFD